MVLWPTIQKPGEKAGGIADHRNGGIIIQGSAIDGWVSTAKAEVSSERPTSGDAGEFGKGLPGAGLDGDLFQNLGSKRFPNRC
jgi:hypothetical protein